MTHGFEDRDVVGLLQHNGREGVVPLWAQLNTASAAPAMESETMAGRPG